MNYYTHERVLNLLKKVYFYQLCLTYKGFEQY